MVQVKVGGEIPLPAEVVAARPNLYIVPSFEEQVEDAIQTYTPETGIQGPADLPQDIVKGAFRRLVMERTPEETKPPHERDHTKIATLLARSDWWLSQLPPHQRNDTVIEAYGLK